MTNFNTIIDDIFPLVDKTEYINALASYQLLIIDDLGVERNSEYALGIIFSVIDRRIRSGRPLIIATNLPLSQIKSETMLDKRRMALLEKLDLAVDKDASDMCGRVGLGTSNIMSMACELLLHNEAIGDNKSCFLLIEEPEAHIHAQRQLKLIQSLEEESEKGNRQTIITTHSPLLASVVKLSNIVIVKSGKVYSLEKEQTKLDEDDYLYLEKYLDATKANLFFARSVIIVEGPGEALLLPTLSKLLGCNFTDYVLRLLMLEVPD